MKYDGYVRNLAATVTQSPGALSPEVRAAILAGDSAKVPPALSSYLEKVALRAHEISDDDVLELRRAGMGEDEIFEATTVAALGAALLRLEKGMAALRAG